MTEDSFSHEMGLLVRECTSALEVLQAVGVTYGLVANGHEAKLGTNAGSCWSDLASARSCLRGHRRIHRVRGLPQTEDCCAIAPLQCLSCRKPPEAVPLKPFLVRTVRHRSNVYT